MRRITALGALSIVALAALAVPTAAHANPATASTGPQIDRRLPFYICDYFSPDSPWVTVGSYRARGNCRATNMPSKGPVFKEFVIERRFMPTPLDLPAIRCEAFDMPVYSGLADLPVDVWGRKCHPVRGPIP